MDDASKRGNPDKALGEAIGLIRAQKHLTRRKLAEQAGLSSSWLAEVEAARSSPSWRNLRRIAYGLGVSLSDLLREVERCEQSPGDTGP
jgi:transcriptional regulator with XRE-family HTH domain